MVNLSAIDDPLIQFKGGFTARTSVAFWYLAAFWRMTFTVVDGYLVVKPRHAVTASDDAFIRAHRDELIACTRYCDEQAAVPN